MEEKSKQRIVADPKVTPSEIRECLEKYLDSVHSKDIWAHVVPPAGGPRVWHWKTKPCAVWMAKTSALIFDLLEVARNGKMRSKKLCTALERLTESGAIKNTSGSKQDDFISDMDITIRILLSHFRTCRSKKEAKQTVLNRLQGADRCKAGEGGGRTVAKIGL